MKATIQIELNTSSPSEAQRTLLRACEELKAEGIISGYHFEISTPEGPVTEICVLENGKVIA